MNKKSSILNEKLESRQKPIPNKTNVQLLQRLPKSICFIDTQTGSGTGAIFEIEEIPKYCFMITCFHVLSPDYVSDALIKFEGCERFTFKPEWIVRKSFKPEGKGDYMALVLQPEAVAFLEKQNLKFLKVKSAKVDEQIVLMGYPEAEIDNPEMCFGTGPIYNINGFTIIYSAGTGAGSSGSPLVLLTGEAIGIHRSRQDTSNIVLNIVGPARYATSLEKIKEDLLLDFGTLVILIIRARKKGFVTIFWKVVNFNMLILLS